MILRRITQAFRKQDWFTVAIETMIVVLGVFIGLQVNNWNEARGARDSERAYLSELRTEIIANNATITEIQALTDVAISAGERSLAFLEGDAPCQSDCWRLLVDFFHASQIAVAPVSLSVIEEMQRQGLPRSRQVKTAMQSYYTGVGSRAAIQELPQYRERVRGLIPLSAMRTLWRDCHSNSYGREQYITDCPAGVSENEAHATLEVLRLDPELHRHLTFLIGQNVLDLKGTEQQIEIGNRVLTAINEELGTK